MKCENDNCKNEVNPDYIDHLCAGYYCGDCNWGDRFCSCCIDCRDECIDGSLNEEEK